MGSLEAEPETRTRVEEVYLEGDRSAALKVRTLERSQGALSCVPKSISLNTQPPFSDTQLPAHLSAWHYCHPSGTHSALHQHHPTLQHPPHLNTSSTSTATPSLAPTHSTSNTQPLLQYSVLPPKQPNPCTQPHLPISPTPTPSPTSTPSSICTSALPSAVLSLIPALLNTQPHLQLQP